MAHFWQKIIAEPSSRESIIRSEVKCLRQYAVKCIEKNEVKDAKDALSTAIELSNYCLQHWKFSTRKRNKRMRETLSDLRQLMKLEIHDHVEHNEMRLKDAARPQVDFAGLSSPIDSLSEDLQKLYEKFSSCIQVPNVDDDAWERIVGNVEAKDIILKSLEYPVLFNNVKKSNSDVNGVLLYGPPGTGKSMIARAVAHKVQMPFLELQVKDIMSKYQGESEQNVAQFFALAIALRPCVIFIDEIDSLLGKRSTDSQSPEGRRGVTNQLLHATQGTPGLFIIGATNTPWQIDSAFLRRFDYKCYVMLPSLDDRKEMFVRFLKKHPHSLLSADIELYARAFEGRSGSEIATFLKKVEIRQKTKLDEGNYFARDSAGVWFLCSKLHPNARKTTLRKIFQADDKFYLPNISVMDFDLVALDKNSTPAEIQKFEEFSSTFG